MGLPLGPKINTGYRSRMSVDNESEPVMKKVGHSEIAFFLY